jgi:hypothetical protein
LGKKQIYYYKIKTIFQKKYIFFLRSFVSPPFSPILDERKAVSNSLNQPPFSHSNSNEEFHHAHVRGSIFVSRKDGPYTQ